MVTIYYYDFQKRVRYHNTGPTGRCDKDTIQTSHRNLPPVSQIATYMEKRKG